MQEPDPLFARRRGHYSAVPVTTPETRYARSEDVNIAYQVFGDGEIDLVYVPGWVSHVELAWELPDLAAGFERLASFSRVILLEKGGTAMSGPVAATSCPRSNSAWTTSVR